MCEKHAWQRHKGDRCFWQRRKGKGYLHAALRTGVGGGAPRGGYRRVSSRAQPLQSVLPHQFLTLRLGVTVKHFNNAPERCSSSQISAFSRSPLQPAAFARMCQRSASATSTPQHRHQLVIFIQSELTRATSASCVQLQRYPLLGRACTSEWLQPHLPQHRHHTRDIERHRAMHQDILGRQQAGKTAALQ